MYALGAVLYATLTGRPPFRAAGLAETLQHVLDSLPVPPRLLNAAVPRDLDAVCLKCLEKRPGDRYPSARALGTDLHAFLEGRSVSAASGSSNRILRTLLRESRHTEEMAVWSRAGHVQALGVLVLFAGTGALIAGGATGTVAYAALWIPGILVFVLTSWVCLLYTSPSPRD